MTEWQSYQKSNKEWQLRKIKRQLQLKKTYAYLFVDNDYLKEIETIIDEYGYKIFYRDKLFFSTGLFLENVIFIQLKNILLHRC